ncbi:Tautomerase/MIF superfamily, partial [Rhodocollybia butyracea]
MPIVQLTTNVKVADEKALSLSLAKAAAESFGMEGFISTSVSYNETLNFGGTHEPAFVLNLVIVGLVVEKHDGYAKSLFNFFEKELGVHSNRGYIIFNDPGAERIGYSGMTYKTLTS